MFMKKFLMKAVFACGFASAVIALVACTDENSSDVWNVAELSSASIAQSSSAVLSAFSSSVTPASNANVTPATVPGPDSSTSNASSSSVVASPGSVSSLNVSYSSTSVADTVWHQANLTWYTSWPEPGSEECIEYNGCTWAGYFAGVEGQMTEEWVSQHNIIAVHEKDWKKYKLKTFRLRMNGSTIDAVVYDMCSDSDCDGCCTENAGEIGFLIDIEKYTRERFDGNGDGIVEWTCLDCE